MISKIPTEDDRKAQRKLKVKEAVRAAKKIRKLLREAEMQLGCITVAGGPRSTIEVHLNAARDDVSKAIGNILADDALSEE